MPEREPPEWEKLMSLLAEFADQQKGEPFLNCIFNRVQGRINFWPLDELAIAAFDLGGITMVNKLNQARLVQTYGPSALTAILDREQLKALLKLDERTFAHTRDALARKRFDLTRDATITCYKRAPLLGPAS